MSIEPYHTEFPSIHWQNFFSELEEYKTANIDFEHATSVIPKSRVEPTLRTMGNMNHRLSTDVEVRRFFIKAFSSSMPQKSKLDEDQITMITSFLKEYFKKDDAPSIQQFAEHNNTTEDEPEHFFLAIYGYIKRNDNPVIITATIFDSTPEGAMIHFTAVSNIRFTRKKFGEKATTQSFQRCHIGTLMIGLVQSISEYLSDCLEIALPSASIAIDFWKKLGFEETPVQQWPESLVENASWYNYIDNPTESYHMMLLSQHIPIFHYVTWKNQPPEKASTTETSTKQRAEETEGQSIPESKRKTEMKSLSTKKMKNFAVGKPVTIPPASDVQKSLPTKTKKNFTVGKPVTIPPISDVQKWIYLIANFKALALLDGTTSLCPSIPKKEKGFILSTAESETTQQALVERVLTSFVNDYIPKNIVDRAKEHPNTWIKVAALPIQQEAKLLESPAEEQTYLTMRDKEWSFLMYCKADDDTSEYTTFWAAADVDKKEIVNFVPRIWFHYWANGNKDLQQTIMALKYACKQSPNKWLEIPAGNYRHVNDDPFQVLGAPRIYYRQHHEQNTCVFSSLASALLTYGDLKAAAFIAQHAVSSVKQQDRIQYAITLLRTKQFHYKVVKYGPGTIDILQQQYFDPVVCILEGSDKAINHAVTIFKHWIFDSNCNYAQPLTQGTLDWCCSSNNNEVKFVRVHQAVHFFLEGKNKERFTK